MAGFWRKLVDGVKSVWRAVTPAPAEPLEAPPPPEPPREMPRRLFIKRPRRPRVPPSPQPGEPPLPPISKTERDRARRRERSAELAKVKEALGLKSRKAAGESDEWRRLQYLRKNRKQLIEMHGGKWYNRELSKQEILTGQRLDPEMLAAMLKMEGGKGAESSKRLQEIRAKLKRSAKSGRKRK